jgi:hypothetical protein
VRYFKQVTKNGKTVLTLSLWGEEGHDEDLKDLIFEMYSEVFNVSDVVFEEVNK